MLLQASCTPLSERSMNIVLIPILLFRGLSLHAVSAGLLVVVLGSFLAASIPARANEPETGFIAGADCSHVGFFETHGKAYREGGTAVDPFVLLKRDGVNCVRLRLFTSSDAQAKQ